MIALFTSGLFFGQTQSSGVQLNWTGSVDCQVYSNTPDDNGKHVIFIEDILSSDCVRVR
ncbi:MAG: hypothetical protein H7174_07320 [Flavobacterium sp.]|nr:hypothetical protein [Flavobacterium sp.]